MLVLVYRGKMKVLEICNNYNSNTDGIGKFAKIIADAYKTIPNVQDVQIATGYTRDDNRLKMLLSFKMTAAMNRAIKIFKKNNIDVVIIEYPFQEYNPLFLLSFLKLSKLCHKKRSSIGISLHEYSRANPLRKKTIDFMVKNVDLAFVSNTNTKEKLSKINKNIFVRQVFSEVAKSSSALNLAEKDNLSFVYFGLVNRTKAFNEMMEAWQMFNRENKYSLKVITSTDLSEYNLPENRVEVYKNLHEDKVGEILASSRFIILPIIPKVSETSSTFKASSQYGDIAIGCFIDDFKTMDFAVNLLDYTVDSFIKSFKEATQIKIEELDKKSKKAIEFGNKFTPEATAEFVLNTARKFCKD